MHVKYSSYHASVLYCEIPSSNFEVKMERTKFYETLYQKALEFANNKELIQQTVPPKVVIKSSIKLFFWPLFKKHNSD